MFTTTYLSIFKSAAQMMSFLEMELFNIGKKSDNYGNYEQIQNTSQILSKNLPSYRIAYQQLSISTFEIE